MHADGEPRHTYAGIAVLRPSLIAPLADGPHPLGPLLRTAMARNAVSGQLHTGRWTDVGTLERLDALRRALADNGLSPR